MDAATAPREALLDDTRSLNVAHVPSGAARRCGVLCDGGFWTAVLTISNAALGAGLLSVPYAIASAGWLTGGLATLVLVVLCFGSLCVIMGRMERAQAADPAVTSFGALVSWACGPAASWFVELLVILNSFGACVGYLVLLGDVLTPLLRGALHSALGTTDDQSRTLVVVGAAALCLLLCFLRRISALRYSAAVAIFACFFTCGMLVVKAVRAPCRLGDCEDELGRNGWCTAAQAANKSYSAGGLGCNAANPTAGVSAVPLGVGALLRAFPLLINAMQCHIQCAFVFAEMPLRIRAPAPRRAVAATAMSLLLGFYLTVGAAGFLRFGAQTQSDCLENFDASDPLANVARVAVGITALSAFPMQHFPARAVAHRVWRECLGCGSPTKLRMSNAFVLLEAPLWVGVTTTLALLVGSHLGFVFELLGAVVVGAVVFLVPAALLLRAGQNTGLAALFIVLGGFLTVSGTYISIEQKLAGTGG